MTLTVEAIYENGVLRPTQPLPFKESQKVELTVMAENSQAMVFCTDPKVIEWAAMDKDVEYPAEDE